MADSEKSNSPEPDSDFDEDAKMPKIWGLFYFILGLIGLAFSVYAVIFSIGMVPLFGTVVAGVLLGLLSILILIYGYRIMRKDM